MSLVLQMSSSVKTFRYKRQMDEMQRTFNQTQSKLKEMSAVVEENNIKHTRALEKEAEKLQQLRSKVIFSCVIFVGV